MCETRTKAQESYLASVFYSTYRVDLSRYPEPGRCRGIRAKLSRFHNTYGQKCVYMSTCTCGDTDAIGMWTDIYGLLAVNPWTWHMGSLVLDVWDVAKRGDPAPLSRMGKLVRRGRRILTGEIVNCSTAIVAPRHMTFSPTLETVREPDQLK